MANKILLRRERMQRAKTLAWETLRKTHKTRDVKRFFERCSDEEFVGMTTPKDVIDNFNYLMENDKGSKVGEEVAAENKRKGKRVRSNDNKKRTRKRWRYSEDQ